MRVLIVPLIVMSAMAGELSEEPNEAQMRGAFERMLTAQVRNAMAVVAESGGPEVVQQIQQNGTDRFELRTFEKRTCARVIAERSYRCDFSVDIEVVNGMLQRALTGRFFAGPQGLMFAQEDHVEPDVSLPTVASVL